jgi:hypothetical protein
MSLLNVGLLSKNIGDGNGDFRDNTTTVVTKNEGDRRSTKNGGHHHRGNCKKKSPRNCD